MKIWFYDVSTSQELAWLDGTHLTFDELYKHHLENRPSWTPLALSQDKYICMDFHPYGAGHDGWNSWAQYFSVTCQILSGHTPSKDEVKVVREYIRRLPNSFKKTCVDKRFVLSFVSYLFIGFKGHLHSGFSHDSNAIDALVEFTLSLCTSKRVLLTSFLCAHREPQSRPGEPLNLLQSKIPIEKIRRASSLLLALSHNASENTRGSAILFQQGASLGATSSIFPEVSVEYMLQARTHEMLERLTYQYDVVSSTVASLPGRRIRARLVSLDTFNRRVQNFLRARYGSNWKQMDYTNHVYVGDRIVELALNMALPEITRMMPFFSENFQKGILSKSEEILRINQESAYQHGGSEMVFRVARVIEWFMQQHSMTISAKAVYETAFYYLWGHYCGMYPGTFAIGLDRDHDRFQNFAWRLGIDSMVPTTTIRQSSPLYARRNPNGRQHGSLSDLSFRQFWRDEL